MMGKFEDLPAEIVYDIFDYFSMSDIFGIFFYLNNHYKNLVLNSRSNIQLDFSNLSKSKFDDCCKYLIEHKQNQINSLSFSNPLIVDDFLNRFSFNKSFNHLETLVFSQINFSIVEPILRTLSNLPCLYSLTIKNNIEVCDSSEIYRLIFNLPVLKICRINPKFYGGSILLKSAENVRSSIEELSIHRHCSLKQLLIFLSYTPNLRRLSHLSISETTTNTNLNSFEIKSSQLTDVSLKFWQMSFETLKFLTVKLFANLEKLNICTRADDYYLIAERWEQLIVENLPNLRRFEFEHYWEPVDNSETEQNTYHRWIDRFTTSFWTDRQWFFAHQHFSRRGVRDSVFYSTNPYRRNLYELHARAHNDDCPRRDQGKNLARRVNIDDYRATINSSLQFSYTTDLCLWGQGARGNFSFISDLNRMFDFTKLTNFSVQCPDFGYQQLSELLNRLPNVHSLTLFTNASYLSASANLVRNHNRIENVLVRGLCRFEQIEILMNLTPNVKRLEIEIDDEQLEMIVRFLLPNKTVDSTEILKSDCWKRKFFQRFSRSKSKNNLSLNDLSICHLNTNNQLFLIAFFNPKPMFEQKLLKIIHKDKLLNDFSFLSVMNYLYLWW